MWKYDVSVIIPVYNREKYIEESVNSILNQTYDVSKIQIILIDDGSTDNSKEICKDLKKQNDNILFIEQENAGVSKARNVGIKNAEGKYILFLDSDDMLESKSLKLLVDFFNAHYDEIDLVTYPMKIYENEKAKPKNHYRYKFYKDGTGVYDLIENPYLGQSTINVMIKNLKEQNILFDKKMDYSEDEAFNTHVLMRKKKIGFCQEATYIYRKNVGSVTKNKSNPYYTFESLTKYNENLIHDFKDKNNKIPKYIQAIILNNLRWRIKTDEIFPYHYSDEEFEIAINRIKNILRYVENGTILNMPSMPIYHKFFVFKMKDMNLKACFGDHIFTIMNNDEVLYSSETIEIAFMRFKIENSKTITILGCVKSPLCELEKPRIFFKYKNNSNEIKEEELKLDESAQSYYQSDIKTNTFYKFEHQFNLEDIQEFGFFALVNNGKTKLNAEYHFSERVVFNEGLKRYVVLTENKKYYIRYRIDKNNFLIGKATSKIIKGIKKQSKICYDIINPKINIYRMMEAATKINKDIWLYYDAANLYDNGYYQFLHDLKKKDGIKRYYVYDGNKEEVKKKFSKEEEKNLIKFGSLKHKIYFFKCKKIFTSDVGLSIYCPFKRSIKWYRDIVNYELIYLQHGVLYANLLRMYGKEFTEIDKIVISSEFEKENFIKNYKYDEKDLIEAGMPRFDINGVKPVQKHEKKRIIYAPSWRKYLVGELVNRHRQPNFDEMKKSSFYKSNVNILTSEKLKDILKKNDITLEFKLHPNFNCYREMFEKYMSENIVLSDLEVSPNIYDMLITDFSSFQFDFIKYNVPIVYFVPDMKEFKAGLHTYRKLDLPLENAFGDVVYTAEDLIKKIEFYAENKFKPEEKYKNKMENFFFKTKDCREKIYQTIKGGKNAEK